LGKIKAVGMPIKFHKSPARLRLPAPEFGQHTEEILLEKGYDWEEIIQLRDEGVI
jgi:crotonobetainyl-CoA:carnitine CoA-transferase CaiB-like acyl-CoA transferase